MSLNPIRDRCRRRRPVAVFFVLQFLTVTCRSQLAIEVFDSGPLSFGMQARNNRTLNPDTNPFANRHRIAHVTRVGCFTSTPNVLSANTVIRYMVQLPPPSLLHVPLFGSGGGGLMFMRSVVGGVGGM
jgi:hypothetical protein